MENKEILKKIVKANKLLTELTINDLRMNINWLRLVRMAKGHLKQAIKELETNK